MDGRSLLLLPVAVAVFVLGCTSSSSDGAASREKQGPPSPAFERVLGRMPVPPGNPQAAEKVELGRLLFFDPRLSSDNQMSCATCHAPERGMSDGLPRNRGPQGELDRNTATIWNVAYLDFLAWDGAVASVEQLAARAIKNPAAMAQVVPELIEELKAIPEYRERFGKVFGGEVSFTGIIRALAAFQRTVITSESAHDRFEAGDKTALSDEARAGRGIFFGKGNCASCHTPPLFTDNDFHMLGVPQEGPRAEDLGRFTVTGDERDRGAFKTPTLRNIELTAPYMHDGVFRTLEDVVAFYDAGGGDVPNKSPLIRPLNMSAEERRALVAYLRALTDTSAEVQPPKLPALEPSS